MSKIKSIFSKKTAIILALIVCIFTISIGYSALNTSLNISGDMSLRIAAEIRVTGIKLSRVEEGAYETYACNYSKDTTITYTTMPKNTSVADYEVTVTNYSDKRYELEDIIVLNHTNSDYVSYMVEGLTIEDIVEPGATVTFIVKILPVTIASIMDDEGYTNTLELKYVFKEYVESSSSGGDTDSIYLKDKILGDNGGVTAISAKEAPSFAQTSTTNEGMYATEDTEGTTYYFRGNVDNNYVFFAGLYWRIVRINGNGSIRLIYHGTSPTDTSYSSSAYRTTLLSKTYHYQVKYYDNIMMTEQSTISSTVNTWYTTNVNNYSDYLDFNSGFCNDTTANKSYSINSNSTITFKSKTRLSNGAPSLACEDDDYMTATNSTLGNKVLTYPVGLITMDEVMLAGGYSSNNTSYYLSTGNAFWTMTPSANTGLFAASASNIMLIDANGKIDNSTDGSTSSGVRPVINLKSDVYYGAGNGTADSPYSLKVKVKVDPTPYQNQKTIAETIQTLQEEGDPYIYHHDGTLEDGIDDGSYRYSGDDPNNYLCFGSDEDPCPAKNLYRIISVVNGNLKVITADYATTEMLGTDGAYIGLNTTTDSSYKGDLTQSEIPLYAYNNSNGELSTNDWPGPLMTTNFNVNFYSQFEDKWKSKILDVVWHHNTINYFVGILNPPAYAYSVEMASTSSSSDVLDGVSTYDKFGVLYNFEYGFSASPSAWHKNMNQYSSKGIKPQNWLYLGKKEWTISHGTGGDGKYAAAINADGSIGYKHVYEGLPVRITFYVDGTSMYTSGIGSKDNPLRIS